MYIRQFLISCKRIVESNSCVALEIKIQIFYIQYWHSWTNWPRNEETTIKDSTSNYQFLFYNYKMALSAIDLKFVKQHFHENIHWKNIIISHVLIYTRIHHKNVAPNFEDQIFNRICFVPIQRFSKIIELSSSKILTDQIHWKLRNKCVSRCGIFNHK